MAANPKVAYTAQAQVTLAPSQVMGGEVANDAISSRMEHILQAMPSGVVILNGDGVVTDANPVAVQLLGQPLAGIQIGRAHV